LLNSYNIYKTQISDGISSAKIFPWHTVALRYGCTHS